MNKFWILYCLFTQISAFNTHFIAKNSAVKGLRSSLNANIAVFGGTGKTGSECVLQSINKGCKAYVLARNPENMKVPIGSGGARGGSMLYDPNLKVLFLNSLYYIIVI